MKFIKVIIAILVLGAVFYWLWTGNNELLPYVMLAAAASMLSTVEEFSRGRKSLGGYLFFAGFLTFGSYGIALLFS